MGADATNIPDYAMLHPGYAGLANVLIGKHRRRVLIFSGGNPLQYDVAIAHEAQRAA